MKLLKEIMWCSVAGLSIILLGKIPSLTNDLADWLWALPLYAILLIPLVVGIRRGFPDGIWGIK